MVQKTREAVPFSMEQPLFIVLLIAYYFTSSKEIIYEYQSIMFLWYKYDTDIVHRKHRLHYRF